MLSLNPKLLQEAFPINKVEIFFDDLDHSNFLGCTWEMISQGRVPVGLDTSDTDFNIIGKTGGEKTHKLTFGELPSGVVGGGTNNRSWAIAAWGDFSGSAYVTTTNNDSHNTNSNGISGQPHNNLQPYIVMAFWRRIA